MMNNEQMKALTATARAVAVNHGFPLLRVSEAAPATSDADIASQRIKDGKFSGLQWFTEDRIKLASQPTQLLPTARSVVTFAVNYYDEGSESLRDSNKGYVARYAVGKDYHRTLKKRLSAYMLDLITAIGFSPEYRIFVDDSPLLERAFARMSGLGWIGKNTNLLVPGSGSWVLLAEIITSLELIPDTPVKKTCGTCTKCIDICPTGAISADYQVDNDRCISYLTIENRGAIPRNLRNGVGTWIFGCDLCQEICPVNRKAKGVIFDELRIRQDLRDFDMREILSMDESAFLLRFQGTPVMRAKLKGMQRNVCVALGNIGDIEDVALLTQTLCNSAPLVRGHAAWALSQIPSPGALTSLKKRLSIEQDAWVLGELEDAVKAHTLV
jgi:epoxyqueuosine reductase